MISARQPVLFLSASAVMFVSAVIVVSAHSCRWDMLCGMIRIGAGLG